MEVRRKLLIILQQRFWSSPKGSSVRIRQLITQLSKDYQMDLFHLRHLKPGEIEQLRACSPEIAEIFYPPRGPAAWLDTARAIVSKITQPPDDQEPSDAQPSCVKDWRISHALRRVLSERTYDVLLFEYIWTAKTINAVTRGLMPSERWVDTIDVMHQRYESSNQAGIKSARAIDEEEEKRYLRKFSKIIAIQPEEAAVFERMMPEKEVITIPIILTVDLTTCAALPPGFTDDGAQLLHVSSSDTIAINSMHWFLDEVWPDVLAAEPKTRLHLAGSICECFANEKHPRVILHGYVDDLAPLYQHATLTINPCLAGSGIKVKTLEALAYRKAMITTSFGGQGLDQAEHPNLVISSQEKFVDAILKQIATCLSA